MLSLDLFTGLGAYRAEVLRRLAVGISTTGQRRIMT